MNCRSSSVGLAPRTKIESLSSSNLARKLDLNLGCWTCKFPQAVQQSRVSRPSIVPNINDSHPCVSVSEENRRTNQAWNNELETFLSKWSPPGYSWRGLSVLILAGQVISTIIKGKVHWSNTLQQLEKVGPKSVGVCLLTSAFVGMAFTIQFVREFTRLGLNRAVGGVLALAFSRELSPVVTSVVVAGRIGNLGVHLLRNWAPCKFLSKLTH